MSLKCPECEYVTEYKNILSRHINKNHTNILEPKKCPMCLKNFASVATCKRHVERNVCQKGITQEEKEKDPLPTPLLSPSPSEPSSPILISTPHASSSSLVLQESPPQIEIQPAEPEQKQVYIHKSVAKIKANYFKYIALSMTIIIGKIIYSNIRKTSRN